MFPDVITLLTNNFWGMVVKMEIKESHHYHPMSFKSFTK
jgi:hypothetical protein